MGDLKFMFGKDSKWKRDGKGFWVSLIIYNTSDGISKVELNNGGGWQKASMVGGKLGSQWNLPQPSNYRNYGGSRILNVRVRASHHGRVIRSVCDARVELAQRKGLASSMPIVVSVDLWGLCLVDCDHDH